MKHAPLRCKPAYSGIVEMPNPTDSSANNSHLLLVIVDKDS